MERDGEFIMDDEAISKIEKVNIFSYGDDPSSLRKYNDNCSGHCISGEPGTLGHHDNRQPLY
jgi:hypothetical protein